MGFSIQLDKTFNNVRNTFVSLQRGDTVYDYIENMEPLQLFSYVAIAIGVLYIFQYLHFTLTHIVAIIVGLVLMFYFNMKDKRNYAAKMDDLYFKLHLINPQPTYFYMDSDIIELVDDIKEYREYNIVAWSRMIYALDNFLEIVHDFEIAVEDRGDNLDIMMHQKQKAITNLQSILFKLPVNRALEYKLERAVYYMNLILQRHIDAVIHDNEKDIEENGYHTKTKIYYFDQPKGLDSTDRSHYNYH